MQLKKFFAALPVVALLCLSLAAQSQSKNDREIKYLLNDDGSHYLKTTVTAQIWSRFNESNPGTTKFGYGQDQTFDIGLRRVRSQVFGKITDKVFFYSQFGTNNFNDMGPRKPGIFFHDVVADYQITPRSLQLGMGLSGWNGLARFSSAGIGTILGYDAPLYQQTTNDVSDQFLRKLSIYAKGKISKLDYRFVLSDPMAVQNSASVKAIQTNSDFSYKPAKLQSGAYLMWQFLDEESNLTPYNTGTYLGKKKVFNIGAGFQYQPKAMWHYSDTTISSRRIIEENLLNLNADVFYDVPVGKKGAAFSFYSAITHLGFGKNYLRSSAVMNPADAGSVQSLAGGGNSIPLYGTGNVLYFQSGYLMPTHFLGENNGQVQPYFMWMHGNFHQLKDPMNLFDLGVNYYMDGHRCKLSLNYQNRPVFNPKSGRLNDRKSALILQFQVAF